MGLALQIVAAVLWVAYGLFVASKNTDGVKGQPFTAFSLIVLCIIISPAIFVLRALGGAFYIKKFL